MPETAPPPDAGPFEARPFRAGDETALTALFSRTFGRSIEVAHLRWKLDHTCTPGPAVPNVLNRLAAPSPLLRVYQIQVPLTGQLVSLVCHLQPVQTASEAALRVYESQADTVAFNFRKAPLQRNAARGLSGAAEEFWALPAARYAELHCEAPEPWRKRYRGFRQFPLTAPLACLVGRRWRSKLSA